MWTHGGTRLEHGSAIHRPEQVITARIDMCMGMRTGVRADMQQGTCRGAVGKLLVKAVSSRVHGKDMPI